MDNLKPGQFLPGSRSAVDFCASTTLCHCSLHRLTALLILSLSSLLTDQVEAADSCRRGTTVINGPVAISCSLAANDALSVTPTGSLSVTSGAAVSITGAARQLLNQGTITGPIGITIDNSDGVGKVSNSGTVTGTDATLRITDSRLSGPLINSGTLAWTGTDIQHGDVIVGLDTVVLERGFTNSGTIDATGAEVAVSIVGSTVTGNIANSGSLLGGSEALRIQDSQINGSVRNAGTIDTSLGNALTVIGSHVTGDVANSGNLFGFTGIANSTVDGRFINTGSLRDGIDAFRVSQSTLGGGFYNSGTLYSGEGVTIIDSTLKRFENNGVMAMSEADLTFNRTVIQGDLLNRGSIAPSSDGFGGLALYAGNLQGNLINLGTIEGGTFGPALRTDEQANIGGSVTNSGRLIGSTGVDMRNTAIGGDFSNRGQIIGNFQADEHHGSGVVINTTQIAGTFTNTGLISGLEQGAALTDVQLGKDFSNRGRIIAARDALTLTDSTVAGRWLNYGYIGVDTEADPQDFYAAANGVTLSGVTVQGRAMNTGTVRGNAIGLNVIDSQLKDGLVNTGTLRGASYSLYVDETSQLDNLYIGGDGTARFQGAVYAPATTATVYSDARYRFEARDVWQVERLVNRGIVELAAPVASGGYAPSLSGDYVQKPGAILRTEVQDSAHYGRLDVYGTATLPTQARIDVDVSQARQPFTTSSLNYVLTATTLVSDGTFAVTSNSALFDFGARKQDNHVDLLLTPKSTSGVASAARAAGLSSSVQGAAQVVDQQLALGSASTLTPYFVSATSSQQVASALTQTLPLDNAALRASQATLASIGSAVKNRLDGVTGLSAFGFDGAAPPTGQALPGFWTQPFSYSSGLSNTTVEGATGTVIGFDARTSAQRRSGWAFAYANGGTGTQLPNASQRSQLDLWQFLGYSSYTLSPGTEFMLYGGAGRNTVNGQRRLAIAGLSGSAQGDYDSLMATLGASLGHAVQVSERTRLIPSLRLDFNHIRDGAYRERGSSSLAPLMLDVGARSSDQLIAGFDTRLEQTVSAATRLTLNVGVGYDLINRPVSTTAAFVGAPQQRFDVTGEAVSPWLMRGGVGMSTQFRNGAQVSLTYDAQTRTDFTDQVASVKASLPF